MMFRVADIKQIVRATLTKFVHSSGIQEIAHDARYPRYPKAQTGQPRPFLFCGEKTREKNAFYRTGISLG